MVIVSLLLDALVVFFSAVLVAAVPLLDAQMVLPARLYPPPLVELSRWYAVEFGDYLVAEKPHFLVGLVWVEIALVWPLSLANVYGILARRRWALTTSLMAGVSVATSMAAVMAELIGSGRASDKLLWMYTPFGFFAMFAILRGFISRPQRINAAALHASSSRKKRA